MFPTVHLIMHFETMRPLCEIRGRAHGEPKARCDETKPIASPNSFMVSYVIIYMTLLLHTHRYAPARIPQTILQC